ncbi:hypothetical protein [Micromonospora sp. HM5-17]|jgi:hypothetical protein|uniref:hypothetical protein n=1 Tax=Micromonospora sp. HM5-17 TaxID=2487710 RepID=UPI000F45F9B6|nr:hypothetical protein [Micromonospora sp. HM5-17]ROT32291.1 hypothetical protein EF879_11980 [Micromonospora sp. HM5-17]
MSGRLGRLVGTLVGVALLLLAFPGTAHACELVYQQGMIPQPAGCSSGTATAAALTVTAAVAIGVVTLTVAGYLSGAMSRSEFRAVLAALLPAPPATVGLHSRRTAITNQEVLRQGIGLPRTMETVLHHAELAGIDLQDVDVEIVEDTDTLRYFDFMGACARTDDLGIQLGPAAFVDAETLVRTLGHESIHVQQWRDNRVNSNVVALEEEAYAAEDGFVERWQRAAEEERERATGG